LSDLESRYCCSPFHLLLLLYQAGRIGSFILPPLDERFLQGIQALEDSVRHDAGAIIAIKKVFDWAADWIVLDWKRFPIILLADASLLHLSSSDFGPQLKKHAPLFR
jgi:hypothetical protein